MNWFTTTGRGENDMCGVSVLVVRVYVHMLQEQNDSNSLRLCSSYLLFRVAIFSAVHLYSKVGMFAHENGSVRLSNDSRNCVQTKSNDFFLPVYLFSMLKPLFFTSWDLVSSYEQTYMHI